MLWGPTWPVQGSGLRALPCSAFNFSVPQFAHQENKYNNVVVPIYPKLQIVPNPTYTMLFPIHTYIHTCDSLIYILGTVRD